MDHHCASFLQLFSATLLGFYQELCLELEYHPQRSHQKGHLVFLCWSNSADHIPPRYLAPVSRSPPAIDPVNLFPRIRRTRRVSMNTGPRPTIQNEDSFSVFLSCIVHLLFAASVLLV